ncbi:hypothetical protein [Nocardioides sp.]|uniref:hypothetical protein n=1 Tax=Nocardioides sp. TaxID=35761 RepID=UPI003563DAC5
MRGLVGVPFAGLLTSLLLAGCAGSADLPASTVGSSSPVESPAAVPPPPPPPPPPLKSKAERKAMAELAALAEAAASTIPQTTSRVPTFSGPVLGADASWPQCPRGMGIPQRPTLGAPMPLPAARYVVLGLTNGPGYTPNPCLADQVEWIRERRLLAAAYAVISYPDDDRLTAFADAGPFQGKDRLGALANAGYQQARYALGTMAAAGLESPIIWLDVEPVRDFEWSGDVAANAAVVRGAARGFRESGRRIGVYSTPYLWRVIVGGLRLGVPEWRAAGHTSRAEAAARCGDDWSIQGGPAILGQWVEQGRDQNITCGRVHRDLGRWFHAY